MPVMITTQPVCVPAPCLLCSHPSVPRGSQGQVGPGTGGSGGRGRWQVAEPRLPLRLGAGSGGMETGPRSAEPEERGQCCCVLDSRTTHTGVPVGQLPASAPRHAPVLSARHLLGGLVPVPPFAVFSAQGPVRSRSSRIRSADGQAGPGDQGHELVPGEWAPPPPRTQTHRCTQFPRAPRPWPGAPSKSPRPVQRIPGPGPALASAPLQCAQVGTRRGDGREPLSTPAFLFLVLPHAPA